MPRLSIDTLRALIEPQLTIDPHRWPDHKGDYHSDCPYCGKPAQSGHVHFRITGGKVYCQVCQQGTSLYALAQCLGIDTSPLSTSTNGSTRVEYDYHDANGKCLYQAVRYYTAAGIKKFCQRQPDGHGGWINNITKPPIQRVLYRLPKVVQAVTAGETIYVVEGEKDCDNLRLHGLTATTNVGGAGKWCAEYSDTLTGANVVILEDNDPPGQSHAQAVEQSLQGKAKSIHRILLPGLQPKGDVTDWLYAGHTIAELHAILGNTPQSSQQQPGQQNLSGTTVFHCTDLGNARRLVARHGANLHYIGAWGCWLIWDGSCWMKDETGEIQRLARDTVASIYAEAAASTDQKQRRELGEWALASESKGRLEAMVALAQDEPGIHIRHDALDTLPWLLPARNGTIDLRTGKLQPHKRSDLLTKCIPVDYDPDAQAPTWDAFISLIMNDDQDLITFLQRATGYTLTGDTSEQCLFFAYGTGKNGKSTFTETIKGLLGDYAQKAPANMLMQKQSGAGIPNDVARLPGARFVIASELEEGRRLDESLIKDLTGGDSMPARFMRQEWFEFIPTHKLWIYGNHKPQIRGTDEGIWRRIHLIPFRVFIKPEIRDPHLKTKLQAELSGILAWMVRGCLGWQKNGLAAPVVVEEATNAYRSEMDVVGQFMDDCVVRGAQMGTPCTAMYSAYVQWAEAGGEHPINQRRFGAKMTERGIERDRRGPGGVWRYAGVGLTSDRGSAAASDGLMYLDPIDPIDVESDMNKAHKTHVRLSQNQCQKDQFDQLDQTEALKVDSYSPIEQAQGAHLPKSYPFAAIRRNSSGEMFVIVASAGICATDKVELEDGTEQSVQARFYAIDGENSGTRADQLEYVGEADEAAYIRACEEAAAADRSAAFNQRMSKQREAARGEQKPDPAFRSGRALHAPRVGQHTVIRIASEVVDDELAALADELFPENEPDIELPERPRYPALARTVSKAGFPTRYFDSADNEIQQSGAPLSN